MNRETSAAAFRTIKDNGLLSHRRFQVYEMVFAYGPCSARDVYKRIISKGFSTGSITTRFSELVKAGVIEEIGTKLDEETRQTVLVYQVTGLLPKKIIKPKKHKCLHCDGIGYFLEQQTS